MSLRLETGFATQDELSDTESALHVLFLSASGRAYLHCEPPPLKDGPVALRGARDGVDTLEVAVPRWCGTDCTSLWVASASGTWRVERATLDSGADSSPLRFAASPGAPLELRQVVKPEPSAEDKESATARSLEAYSSLKLKLLGATAALSLPGSLAIWLWDVRALPSFLDGVACGILYLLLLERGVDGLRGGQDARGTDAVARLAVTALALAVAGRAAVEGSAGDVALLRSDIIALVLGFFVYKVGVVAVAAAGVGED
jgi:hypothetical protein